MLFRSVYNIVGGMLYPGCFLLLGYALGRTVPGIDGYVVPIVTLIAVAFAVPPLVHRSRSLRAQRLSGTQS